MPMDPVSCRTPDEFPAGMGLLFPGMPRTKTSTRKIFLPKVVFHSLKHTSITYKLKLNGDDIKSVQGDSGHTQRFEDEFYSGKVKKLPPKEPDTNHKEESADAETNAELLPKLLADPETAELLKKLAGSLNTYLIDFRKMPLWQKAAC